jgi:hypothetical protein
MISCTNLVSDASHALLIRAGFLRQVLHLSMTPNYFHELIT